MNLPPSAYCPVCGQTVDLTDEAGALAHMEKDDAHKKAAAEARSTAALDAFLRSMPEIIRVY